MIDEDNIRKQYQDHEIAFTKIMDQLLDTLHNIEGAFYQQTKFKVRVLEPRLKGVGSIISKMKRKGLISDSLFIRNNDQLSLVVNDFLGARISCNTREDVKEITKLISQSPRFKVIKCEDFTEKPKPSGYRAVHLDVLYQVHWKDELIYIPVEIQIKTHLQNAWADITHDESYKPEDENLKNKWEHEYSKHLADMLDTLDNMASTIRKQRLNLVPPPKEGIHDSDTLINPNTLSYKLDQLKDGARLTQQEIKLIINRLKEESFETLAEVGELLQDHEIEKRIKEFKREKLRSDENVQPFEILYYGSLLKQGKESKFKEEMRKDYGFVQHQCLKCNKWLTGDEYKFIKTKTDSDTEFYCSNHRAQHFDKQCSRCGILTSKELCKSCEAEAKLF